MREVTLPAIIQARDTWKASPEGQAACLKFAAVPAAPAVVPALVLSVPVAPAPGAVDPSAVAMAIKLPAGPVPGVVPPAFGAPAQPANLEALVAAQVVLTNHLAAVQRNMIMPPYNPLLHGVGMDYPPPGSYQQPTVIGQSFISPTGESPLVLFVLFI